MPLPVTEAVHGYISGDLYTTEQMNIPGSIVASTRGTVVRSMGHLSSALKMNQHRSLEARTRTYKHQGTALSSGGKSSHYMILIRMSMVLNINPRTTYHHVRPDSDVEQDNDNVPINWRMSFVSDKSPSRQLTPVCTTSQ